MILKAGDIVKHFKGEDLIEKNIYKIISVSPEYTGTNTFPDEPVVVYESLFQERKGFVREYASLVEELSPEQKEKFNQDHRVDLLTEEEIKLIRTPEFIAKKMAYIAMKYNDEKKTENEVIPSSQIDEKNVVWKLK
ncbi:MAG: DUF1653 domain-containing protein [Bacilli bacterium]|jgi:hypothetical protein|nr:DUF1653 domain-containing protein [Bacilli bacterium]